MIVDDHPIVRQGLRMSFAGNPALDVVAEAAHGREALTVLDTVPVDVVLMDLQMPTMDGVAATRAIVARPDHPAVLILTTYDSDADILAALDAGASGYLLKDAAIGDIVSAAQAAAAGRSALSPEVADRLRRRRASPLPQLSPRELEILDHLAGGATNAQIAGALFISQATVKTHLLRMFDKLGARSRTEAVAIAREQRLIRNA